MAQKLNPFSGRQFLDASGNPYVGAQLFTYVAGSSTKATVTKDSAGVSSHANPIILNSRGEPGDGAGASQAIWQPDGVSIKLVLAPPTDTDPPVSAISTWDNLDGINDITLGAQDQWIAGPAPTYVSATSFTLVGDQTTDFHVGRRLKSTNSGGTIYSTIIGSAYTSLTTITVANDSGAIDSGLSAVSYALLSSINPSVPDATPTADAGGTVDAITATFSPAIGLVNDSMCIVRAAGANATTTPTFSPNGAAAKTIVRDGGQALVAGDIRGAGHYLILKYNLANDNYELLNASTAGAIIDTLETAGLHLLQTVVASSDATVEIDSAGSFDVTNYDDFLIVCTNIKPANDGVDFRMRYTVDGGATWLTSANYNFGASTGDTAITLFAVTGSAANEDCSGSIFLWGPHKTGSLPNGWSTFAGWSSTPVFNPSDQHITYRLAAQVDGIQFFFSAGNIASGTFKLYGIK